MKIAFHEITTRDGSFEEHLPAYAKTGWRHFEINLWKAEGYIREHGAAKTAALVRDHGLTCVAATGLGLSAFKSAAARSKDIETVKCYGEVLQALGCRPLVIGSDAPEKLERATFEKSLDELTGHVRAVARAAERFGVALAVEVNWVALCRSYRTAAELVRRVEAPNVGLVWDPAHFFSTPSRVDDLDLARGRIVHAHLDDIRPCFTEVIDVNADRVLPGEGVLPLRAWADKVAACGYQGWHSVELFNPALWAKDLETICRETMQACKKVWPEAEF